MARHRAPWVGALGLTIGATAALLAPTSACIIPDYCILIYSKGANWCSTMEHAMKWPAGHPELAEPILSDDLNPPKGCTCVNETEDAILDEHVPAEAYAVLEAEVQAITREKCLTLALGFANNCLVEEPEPNAPTILLPTVHPGLHGPCVGDCEYINPPPFEDCPANPDPFECEGLVSVGGNDEADEGAPCPIGAEDCPCTVGGACDSNLECVDGMCVPLPADEEIDDDGSDAGPVLECPDDACSVEGALR